MGDYGVKLGDLPGVYVPRVGSEGPTVRRKFPVWRIFVWILGVGCLTLGVNTLQDDPDWSGWVAGAVGLGLLAWLAVAELRGRHDGSDKPRIF